MASWDEAKRCPRCNKPGAEAGQKSDGGGGKLKFLECQNDQCVWFEEKWVVQVRADGTIPDPSESAGQRAFPPQDNAVFGSDDQFEQVREALRASQNQMQKPGGGETSR